MENEGDTARTAPNAKESKWWWVDFIAPPCHKEVELQEAQGETSTAPYWLGSSA